MMRKNKKKGIKAKVLGKKEMQQNTIDINPDQQHKMIECWKSSNMITKMIELIKTLINKSMVHRN